MTLRIVWCARCQGEHESVEFRQLSTPLVCGDWTATHWASCPANGEPILLLLREEPDDRSDALRAPE